MFFLFTAGTPIFFLIGVMNKVGYSSYPWWLCSLGIYSSPRLDKIRYVPAVRVLYLLLPSENLSNAQKKFSGGSHLVQGNSSGDAALSWVFQS